MRESRGRHSRLDDRPAPVGPPTGYPTTDHTQVWEQSLPPFDQLDVHWDPAEELAHLLHEAVENEKNDAPPPPEINEDPVPEGDGAAPTDLTGSTGSTAELPAQRSPVSHHRRSRSRPHKRTRSALRATSFLLAALAAAVVSMVCVFGGLVSYDPLRLVATYRTTPGAVGWWPLLVYGPWVVASLSILRAALHRRRAAHSWAIVLFFSIVSILLCVAQVPRPLVEAAAAALPALAALACFQQLVRQITLTRPPRQATPRHRNRNPRPRQHPTDGPPKTT